MKKIYYFKSIKYIANCGLITSLLIVIGLITILLPISFLGGSFFEISTGFLFSLTAVIEGPMMLVSGVISLCTLDLIEGSFIFIPITALISILSFCIIKWTIYFGKLLKLNNYVYTYISFVLAGLLVMIYPFYVWLLFSPSAAITEAIIDVIQFSVSIVISTLFYFVLYKNNLNSLFFFGNYKIPCETKKQKNDNSNLK